MSRQSHVVTQQRTVTLITPSLSALVVTSHAAMPAKKPRILPRMHPFLLALDHVIARAIGTTAEPSITPMKVLTKGINFQEYRSVRVYLLEPTHGYPNAQENDPADPHAHSKKGNSEAPYEEDSLFGSIRVYVCLQRSKRDRRARDCIRSYLINIVCQRLETAISSALAALVTARVTRTSSATAPLLPSRALSEHEHCSYGQDRTTDVAAAAAGRLLATSVGVSSFIPGAPLRATAASPRVVANEKGTANHASPPRMYALTVVLGRDAMARCQYAWSSKTVAKLPMILMTPAFVFEK